MSKHGKAARKASFRFHAHPASEAVLRVLRAYKRVTKRRPDAVAVTHGGQAYFYGPSVLFGWQWFR